MNIWLLTIGEPLPLWENIRLHRTGVLAQRLVGRGHRVTWWTSAFEHQRKEMFFDADQELSLPGGPVLRILRGCGYSRNVSLKRFIDHRIIAAKFRKAASQLPPPDVIIASMPCYHLAFEAVQYAKARGIPVLVDIRDLWPDIFLKPLRGAFLKGLGRLALGSEFSRLKKTLKQADGLVAVSQGYLDWALAKAGRVQHRLDRVIFLGYENALGENRVPLPAWLEGREQEKKILFIGSFGASYELDLIVQAARKFREAGDSRVCFVIAGTGDQDRQIRDAASGLSNIVLPGWIGAAEIRALLQNGFVGLLPYVEGAPQGIPNKPFEYLSAGLPLVSSLTGEMADLVDQHGLGFNYEAGSVDGLVGAIRSLLESDTLYQEFSRNALRFYERYGNAKAIYDHYAEYIEAIWEEKGRGSCR